MSSAPLRVAIPSDDELRPFQLVLDEGERAMGFAANSIKTMTRVPALSSAFGALAALFVADPARAKPTAIARLIPKNLRWSASYMKAPDRVPLATRNFVAFAASRGADCRYCMAHTVTEARHNGATEAQLHAIGDYENSDVFTEAEQAAFRFAEASAAVPSQVTDDHLATLRSFFSEDQVMELVGVVSLFGFLNRYNTALATPLEPEPLAAAEAYLAPHGWTRGVH